ncbi:hypothetical protein [Burkholderia multivorans]|nr:hypothetical protein [Burkholderia multivorans]MBN6728754.1 hypothetical protein [Burkholderia multivorans]
MKRLIRNVIELVSLWTVLGVILFLFVWLVVPRLLEAPAARGVWGA